jgi:biopolymer transport protein ExbD
VKKSLLIRYPIWLLSFVVSACTDQSGPSQSSELKESDVVSEAILVTINSQGEIWIDGEIVDRQALRPTLQGLHAANPEWPLVIHADQSSPPGSAMLAVMDAAHSVGVRSGLEGVSIADIE